MNKHISIFSNLIVLSFFFLSLPVCGYDLDDAEKSTIKNLEKSLSAYEQNFTQTGHMDSTSFYTHAQNYARLIDLYISLNEKYSDYKMTELALVHLEKFKKQKILSLYLNSAVADSARNKLLDIYAQKFILKNCIKQNEAIVDFWIHENKINVFVVRLDTVLLTRLPGSAWCIKERVKELISPLFHDHDLLSLNFDYKLSFQLYELLFFPLEKNLKNIKTINIIPDDFLINFPFELLVTDTTKMSTSNGDILYQDLQNLEYLIHRYAIFYNYSTYALCPKILGEKSRKKIGRRLLTLSDPLIENISFSTNSEIKELVSKYDIKNSDFSTDEISRVSRLLWRHDNFKGEEVTKDYILKNGCKYRWIYSAQPGILENKNPLTSGLIFSTADQNSHDSTCWLSCTDVLYNSQSADLLTMSYTKLSHPLSEQNFGSVALPLAFLFSGIQSTVFSLWAINSISTSQFMSKFYWELKYKRQTNVKALREAKLASMKDTIKFKNQKISRAHPFFWSGFRLIGYPRVTSPSNAPIPPWGVVLIIYFIITVIGVTIARKTLPSKNSTLHVKS